MKDMAQWETLFLNYFQDNISDIQKKKKKNSMKDTWSILVSKQWLC